MGYWEMGRLRLPMPLVWCHTLEEPHPGLASFAPLGRGVLSNKEERRVGAMILRLAGLHLAAVECFVDQHCSASWELPTWLMEDLNRVSHHANAPRALRSLEAFHGLDDEGEATELPEKPLYVTSLYLPDHMARVWADFGAVRPLQLSRQEFVHDHASGSVVGTLRTNGFVDRDSTCGPLMSKRFAERLGFDDFRRWRTTRRIVS